MKHLLTAAIEAKRRGLSGRAAIQYAKLIRPIKTANERKTCRYR